ESGLVVLDIDPRHNGLASLEKIRRKHGLSKTTRVLTGSGGHHLYFKHPGGEVRNSTGLLGEGLDVRGDGGYIVAPPSVPPETGNPYKWLHSLELLADCPVWLRAGSQRRNGTAPTVGKSIPEGQRDRTLASLAGSMRRRGMEEPEILVALLETNRQRCTPPLVETDVERIAASIARYPAEPGSKQPDESRSRIAWQRGSEVEVQPIVFLDRPLLQASAFHLLCGRKGHGKGTLLALFAASVMRGELGPKRNVLWIGS